MTPALRASHVCASKKTSARAGEGQRQPQRASKRQLMTDLLSFFDERMILPSLGRAHQRSAMRREKRLRSRWQVSSATWARSSNSAAWTPIKPGTESLASCASTKSSCTLDRGMKKPQTDRLLCARMPRTKPPWNSPEPLKRRANKESQKRPWDSAVTSVGRNPARCHEKARSA